jgi:FtsP/CotA-like multicopper oxidase with cupredoxin domain
MQRAFISTIALAFALTLGQPAAAQDPASSIVGVWKLTSFARKEVGTDKTFQPYGEHPMGYRVHTRGGHALYMFFGENRKAPAGSATDADRIELFKTMTAAGGTYKVEGNKVVFHADVSAAQSLTGGTLTYQFEIAGKTLTMTTDPVKNPAGGPENVFLTTYERVE